MLDYTTLTLAQGISTGWAFLLLVLGFGFIIFVHEMGHFLVAKAVGIKCSQFAVGFGRPLVAWRKGLGFRFLRSTEADYQKQIEAGTPAETMGETEYRLNWMPLGGYVKMVGQEDIDPSKAISDDPRSFMRKPIWARFLVVSAGVTLNALFAIIFFLLAFMFGVDFPAPVVGSVEPGSPAATTPATNNTAIVGLQSGDVITSINGTEPRDFTDIALAAALVGNGDKVALTVQRTTGFNGQAENLEFHIRPEYLPGSGHKLLSIGIQHPQGVQIYKPDHTKAGQELKNILDEMGLRGGMKLVKINDLPITSYYEIPVALQKAEGRESTFTFADEQGQVTLRHTPVSGLTPAEQGDQLLGLVPPVKVIGLVEPRKVVGLFNVALPAEGKFQPGDVIVKAGSVDLPTISQLLDTISATRAGTLSFTILRNGQPLEVQLTTTSSGKVGIYPAYAADTNYVAAVLPESPFRELDLILPARILEVNGKPTASYDEIRRALMSNPQQATIRYELPMANAENRIQTRTIQLSEADLTALAATPWDVRLPPFEPLMVTHKAASAGQAIAMGFDKTHDFMMQTYATLAALLRRTVPVSELHGPVGIAQVGTTITTRGWTYLMFFLGIISINLAVVNFLPFPVLDGGLAVLLLLEKIRGKPVPVSVQTALNFVALMLLLSLFLFVTWNDVSRLFSS